MVAWRMHVRPPLRALHQCGLETGTGKLLLGVNLLIR